MAVTIRKIAEIVGVSRGTVDRALNNRGGVSREVEKRVKEVAQRLDYQPNMMAKALANSHKKLTIGVVINCIGNHFFDKVMIGIKKASREAAGFNVQVAISELMGYDVEDQLEAIEDILNNHIHVLVITPINDKQIIDKLNEISATGIKIITLNADATGIDKLAFVGCNYFKSGQTAAELLYQITNGTVNIGIVTGSNKMLGHTNRISGFREVIAHYANMQIVGISEGFDNDEIAYKNTKKLFADHSEITAVYFCAAGVDGAMKAIIELGLQHKLNMITVDDTDNIKQYLRDDIVSLTVCQQPFKQGYDAIQIALHWIVDGKTPSCKHMYTQNEIKSKYNID